MTYISRSMTPTEQPDKHQLTGIMKKYHSVAAKLSVQTGLLLRGSRLVIPEALQQQVLKQLHEGHQGILSVEKGLDKQCGGWDCRSSYTS